MTSIPENTFSGCARISSLDIPDNVEEIGANAFANCKGLKTLCLGDDLTTIGSNAFEGCDSLMEINIKALNPPTYETGFSSTCYINTKVNVLKGNLEKYQEAEPWKNFWNLSDDLITSFEVDGINYSVINDSDVVITGNSISTLTDLLIKAKVECYGNIYNVVSIESGAFKGCTHLSSVQIEDGIERIGNTAFDGCGNLKKIIIPESVTKIDSNTFSSCRNLTSITIPASVTSIGDYAFSRCNSLTSVAIPENSKLTSIEAFAFMHCKNLADFVLPANVATIEHGIFSGCSNLISITVAEENITYDSREDCNAIIETNSNTLVAGCSTTLIPNSVTSIGRYAFFYYSDLTSITIPNSVAKIGDNAFAYCSSLTSITIPNGVTNIDDKAFYNCYSLTSITIPNSVTSIGCNIFMNCSKLKKLVFEDGDKPLTFSKGAYDTSSGVQRTYVNGTNITFKINYHRVNFSGLPIEQLYLGRNLSNQSRYTISENVDGVDYLITSYDAPFSNLSQLKELIIGENVGVLGPEQEDIPEVGHCITPGSFKYCSSLQTINVKNTTPPMGAEFTNDVYSNAQVIVPKGTVSAYKEADGWKKFSYLQEKVEQYNLTFKIGDEVYLTKKVTEGEKIVLPEEPKREGYTFAWIDMIPEVMPANDLTITGAFTINKYLVTFKIGDEVIAADSLEYGSVIVTPEASEKEGHTFNGWGEVAETVPANDLTYEGSYSVNSYLLNYTVDGGTVQTNSVAYGTAITLLEEPTKEGYTFSGWSEAPETMPAGDVTISGTFTINKYLVTFKIGDEVIAADSLEYGTTIVAPEVPEKEGYTFDGWGEVAETVPASDVTYEGTYTVNIYKVYYYVGDELVHTAEVAYGEAIPEYVYEPTEESHTFLGWIGETYETMPAHDVTYTANIDNGIDDMSTDNSEQPMDIYDLNGRKVTDADKIKSGIYIVNGKKVFIK